jgi:hypothetical protein
VLLSFVAVPTQGHAASGPTVRITLTEMTPAVGRPGRTLHIRGKVMNTGDEALRGLDMAMRLSLTPLGSRSEMAAVAAGETTSRDGRSVADQAAPTSDLAPGDTQEFSIAYRLAKDPDLNEFGVYVLGVEATAKDSQGRGRVGIVRTFLPWVPRHPGFRPSGFTLFWPLIDVPRLLSDGTFANDGLAREMDVGGRLERLVDEGLRLREHLAVTWVVDPDLLRTAEVMANGYSVRAPDGSRVPGGAAAIASSWLAQVRSATAVGDVVALPYGDPDLDAVTHAGMDEDLVDARVLGTRVASEVLGRAVTSNVAWPAGGFTDRHTLAQLRAGGVDAALLNGRAMPPKLPLSYTPGGRATIHTASGTVAALLYDPGLSGLLARNTGSAVLNSQRFIAETALVTAELPSLGGTRKILVTPPRQWSPDGPEIDRLVTASPDASWLSTGSVGQLVRSRPPEVDRVALRYPREERRRQLPASYLSAVQALHDSVDNFAEVLTNPQTFVRGYDASVLRLEASWWRGKESRANRVDQERTRLAALRNRIQVLPGTYTFSSSSGSR